MKPYILLVLKGDKLPPRKYVFMERGRHGATNMQVKVKSISYDLSRAVRGDRFKWIYNCTPWIPYSMDRQSVQVPEHGKAEHPEAECRVREQEQHVA